MAGSMGMAWAGNGRGVAGIPCLDGAGALRGPWAVGGSRGGLRVAGADRVGVSRRPMAPAATVPAPAVTRAAAPRARVRRSHAAARVGVRHVAALAGDVLMALTWAAMIPGLMWLGAAAGF